MKVKVCAANMSVQEDVKEELVRIHGGNNGGVSLPKHTLKTILSV